MKSISPLYLPSSETGRWEAASEWAAELCAGRRALGYTPEAVVAEITGCFPENAISWSEAEFICIDAVMCSISRHGGGADG